MTTYLLTSDLGTLKGGVPNPEAIRVLLRSIEADELPFLNIRRADALQYWIQAFTEVEGLCLEHRSGRPDQQFISEGVTLEQAHTAMMSWAEETDIWRTCVPWRRVEP